MHASLSCELRCSKTTVTFIFCFVLGQEKICHFRKPAVIVSRLVALFDLRPSTVRCLCVGEVLPAVLSGCNYLAYMYGYQSDDEALASLYAWFSTLLRAFPDCLFV